MFHHIVIIGGGPAGVITALTAKNVYPDKSVCVVKQIGDGVIPCAIPYMMYTMSDPAQNAMGNLPLQNAGVDVLVDTALSLDLENRTVGLKEKGDVSFERLVLATGLCPQHASYTGQGQERCVRRREKPVRHDRAPRRGAQSKKRGNHRRRFHRRRICRRAVPVLACERARSRDHAENHVRGV